MATRHLFDDAVLEHSSQSTAADSTKRIPSKATDKLAAGHQLYPSNIPSEIRDAKDEGHVVLLGEDPTSCLASLHFPLSQMSAREVVRTLNSTELGQVITERQLYRHRGLGGAFFETSRKLDFVRYTAWLVSERHRPETQRKRSRPSGRITTAEIVTLLQTQAYRCALSGRRIEPQTASLDHILPISRKGAHSIQNAQILHRQINRMKGTLTNEEFIAVCREVVAFANASCMKEST